MLVQCDTQSASLQVVPEKICPIQPKFCNMFDCLCYSGLLLIFFFNEPIFFIFSDGGGRRRGGKKPKISNNNNSGSNNDCVQDFNANESRTGRISSSSLSLNNQGCTLIFRGNPGDVLMLSVNSFKLR